MNVSELVRKLKTSKQELIEILNQFGFSIGRKAIKINDKMAEKIIREWPQMIKKWRGLEKREEEKRKEREKREIKKEVFLPPFITVKDFAFLLKLPIVRVQEELMKNGVLAALNEKIDFETAAIVAEDLGYKVKEKEREDKEEKILGKIEEIIKKDDPKNLKPRPPVVVILGHVDHGKTKLLDAIRRTRIAEEERGGITQVIGAYQVKKKEKKITFVDTPGHEAFTAMRSKGAKVADIAVLVVAADDGVKPQTIEAIKIIKRENLPFVVAINKIDKPEADIDKVKRELSEEGLIPEDWGGKTICVPISAKKEMGLDDLLEMILLVAQMEKERIQANPSQEGIGVIIESRKDPKEGIIGTVLIKTGTLRKGDFLVIDDTFYGRIKGMRDFLGQKIKEAPPSTPVRILGFKYLPKVGEVIFGKRDLKEVKINRKKKPKTLIEEKVYFTPLLEEEEEKIAELNLILKADVFGSIEAILELLSKIEVPEVKINVISKGLGNILESDILKAEASEAVILGFNILLKPEIKRLAEEKGVEVETFEVIYDLVDKVKEKIQNLVKPEKIKILLGEFEVLVIFKREADYTIIGGRVKSGKIEKEKVEIFRKDELIGKGEILELQKAKQKVISVREGEEFGVKIKTKIKIEKGDIIKVYKEEVEDKKLKL